MNTSMSTAMRKGSGRGRTTSLVLVAIVGLVSLLVAPGASARTGPIIAFSPQTSGSFGFGVVADGSHHDQTFTLTNSGGTASTALFISLSGSTSFSKVGDTCSAVSIGPGKKCAVTIRYAPTGTSTDTASLRAITVKPGPTATVALTGTAGYVDVEFSPSSRDFGSSSGSQSFTATNQGTMATGSYTFAGPTDEHFGLSGTNTCDGSALGVGSSCAFTIGFTAPGGCGPEPTLYLDTASLGSYASVTFQGEKPQCYFLYWANGGDQGTGTTLGRATQVASDVRQSFITGAEEPLGVAIDSSHIYWANFGFQGSGTTIGRADLDGQNANQGFITGADNPAGVAVDGNYIYWTNYLPDGAGSIGRANLDGSNIDQNFISGLNFPFALAVDGSHIYWADTGDSSIARADLDGSNVDLSYISTASPPYGVTVDASHIYWTTLMTNSIGRADLDGQNANPGFITGATQPAGVAVDSSHIYWTNAGDADAVGTTIGRALLDGSGVNESFITGAIGPTGIASGQ